MDFLLDLLSGSAQGTLQLALKGVIGLAAAGVGAAVLLAALLVLRKIWMLIPPKTRMVLGFAGKLAFVAGLFVFLFRPETFGFKPDLFSNITPLSLFEAVGKIDAGNATLWLSLAVVAKLLGIGCGILRWRILLRAQGVHIPVWYMAKCWFWGRAIGLFLPGTLGLDAYRLVESSRYTGEAIKCTTVVAVEKLTGFIALFTLVFLTVPLGLRLFPINPVMLAIVLGVLAVFIGVSLLVLLQPRIIQVLVAVVPVPRAVRSKIDKLGAAATAYGQRRGALFAALACGLGVHLGIVFMYFCTATALRAAGTGLLEIFFASPLIIVGQVFAPTVSGMGVREVVMTTLLGGRAGGETAFLFGHLGLWVGEIVPFLLSLPLLLFTTRPNRDTMMEEIASVRAAASHADAESLHLKQEEIRAYEGKVFGTLAAGLFGGIFAGALIGLAEAAWLRWDLAGLTEIDAFIWGAYTYGFLFAGVGLGVAAGLLFLYLLFDRFASWLTSFALCYMGAFTAGGLVIGLFRYKRDILEGHNPNLMQMAALVGIVLGAALITGLAGTFKVRVATRIVKGPIGRVALGVVAFALMVLAGVVLSNVLKPHVVEANFIPQGKATGPNVFLIAVDTLRADYVQTFNPDAKTVTPSISSLAEDGVLYANAFSQASWTKASFGTIFTGMYPECHTAVTKTASLPPGVDTIAELLTAEGYYTRGYSNNPNITSLFGYNQGFTEYIDLRPSLLFAASESASKLSMYEVLRAVREKINTKLPGPLRTKININEYYQPADSVRETALGWLDGPTKPTDTPFFLFTHFMDPHDPYRDPESPDGGYGRKRMGDNPDPAVWKETFQKAYIGEINFLDQELGKFLNGLKERGLYDDALIILTADHGEEFCEHGGWWHGQTLYNEQTRVPMIVKLPGNAHAGERNPYYARNLDLAPTILHFAGLPKGKLMDGQSLFDEAGKPTNESISFAYAENNFEGIVLQAVQTKEGKVIKANEGNSRKLAPVEYYDLPNDPTEQKNLAGDPSVAMTEKQLLDAIDTYKRICDENAVEPAAAAPVSAALQEQLEALGYLGGDESLPVMEAPVPEPAPEAVPAPEAAAMPEPAAEPVLSVDDAAMVTPIEEPNTPALETIAP